MSNTTVLTFGGGAVVRPVWIHGYYVDVVVRAVRDTVAEIGWQRKSVVFPVAYVLGFLWFVQSKGFALALQALTEDWYLFFVPAGAGVALLFFVNLVVTPAKMASEQKRHIDELTVEVERAHPITDSVVTVLDRQMRLGNDLMTHFMTPEQYRTYFPTPVSHFEAQRVMDWSQATYQVLAEQRPQHASRFLNAGQRDYQPRILGPTKADLAALLEAKLAVLGEIIERERHG